MSGTGPITQRELDAIHPCDPKWAKPTKHLPSVLRCASCGHRVLGDGTVAKPWNCG